MIVLSNFEAKLGITDITDIDNLAVIYSFAIGECKKNKVLKDPNDIELNIFDIHLT